MAKIENKVAYPLVKPESNDYVVLTDVSDNNETKTCLVGDLYSFYGWRTFDRTLTAAEVILAETQPIILIDNQGPGTMIVPAFMDAVFSVISNSSVPPVAFNCTGNGKIASGNNTPTEVICYGLDEQNLNQFVFGTGQNKIFGGSGILPSGGNTYGMDMGGLVNSNLVFTFALGEGPTLGNGSLRITFRYRILTGFNL